MLFLYVDNESTAIITNNAEVLRGQKVEVTYNIKRFFNYSFYRTIFDGTTTLTFANGNDTVSYGAFWNSTSYPKQFENINMGGIKSIGGYAFANCYFLEEFTKDDMNAFIQKYFNDTRDALLRNLTKKANQKAIKLMIPVQ